MNLEDAYLFRHALLRDAAYQLHLPADRARLHCAALGVLENLKADTSEISAFDMFRHARDGRSAVKTADVAAFNTAAIDYSLQAGDEARRAFDPAQALSAFTFAADHAAADEDQRLHGIHGGLDVLLQAGRPADSLAWLDERAHGYADHPRIANKRASALLQLGRLPEARNCAEAALPRADSDKCKAELLSTLSSIYLDLAEHTSADAALVSAEGLAADDVRLRCTLLNNAARAMFTRGQWEQAATAYRRVKALANEIDDTALQCAAASGLGVSLLNGGRAEEAEPELTAALGLSRVTGNRREEGVALHNLSTASEWRHDFPRAAELLQQAIERHRESGFLRAEGIALRNLANLKTQAKQVGAAERAIRDAFRVSRLCLDRNAEPALCLTAAVVLRAQGRIMGSRKACDRVLAQVQTTSEVWLSAAARSYHALASLVLWRFDEALETVEAAIAELSGREPKALEVEFGLGIKAQVVMGQAMERVLIDGEAIGNSLESVQRIRDELAAKTHLMREPATGTHYIAHMDEWIAALRDRRWPDSWAGERIDELTPALRLAAVSALREERSQVYAIVKRDAPQLLAAMLKETQQLPEPDWRNEGQLDD